MDYQVPPPDHDEGYDLVDLGLPSSATAIVTPPRPSAAAPTPALSTRFGLDGHPHEPEVAAPTPTLSTPPAKTSANPKPTTGPGLLTRLGAVFRKDRPAAAEPPPSEAPAVPAPDKDKVQDKDHGKAKDRPAIALKPKRKRGKRTTLRYDAPAWVISALIHLGLLGVLTAATLSTEVRQRLISIDAAPFSPKTAGEQAEELVHILADPVDAPRDQAVTAIPGATPGPGNGLGTGTGPPSATPRVGVVARVGERSSLPAVKLVAPTTGLAMLPTAPNRDLGGGGLIAGDVTMGTKDIGEALDQLAREILRHLEAHKLTVVWLFDESGSMKDDQQAIKQKFGRVANELKLNVGTDKKAAGALNHAIVGYGQGIDYELKKPTTDIDQIARAIDRLKVDQTGTENTLHAIQDVIGTFGRVITKDRRLLIVLVTDESGDDGDYVEEARQAAVSRGVPIYIIGRQSLFGFETAHLLYIDPVTKEHYWPAIRRGPEAAGLETLQWDGLHDRWDEQPSGFAPYELARMVKDTGGIYFLLPSEESMRVRQREKAYSMATLKEYVPDNSSRLAYLKHRDSSPLRSTLFQIIQETKGYPYRRHYPVTLPEFIEAVAKEGPIVQQRMKNLVLIDKKLRSIKKYRDREPDKRWQAHYDLMLAQNAVYQVKAYEYLACLDEMVALMKKGKLVPSKMPIPKQLDVTWVINHSTKRKAPKGEIDQEYAEAERLLKEVIRLHPNTPWADLAQDEFNRGFACQWGEEIHTAQYNERAKLVPKY